MTSALLDAHRGEADLIFLPQNRLVFVREDYTGGQVNVEKVEQAKEILVVSCEPNFVEMRLTQVHGVVRISYSGNYSIFWRSQVDGTTAPTTRSSEDSQAPVWTPPRSIPSAGTGGEDARTSPDYRSQMPPSVQSRPGPATM